MPMNRSAAADAFLAYGLALVLLFAAGCGAATYERSGRRMHLASVFGDRATAERRSETKDPNSASGGRQLPDFHDSDAGPALLVNEAAAQRCSQLLPDVQTVAGEQQVDVALLLAVIRVESNFQSDSRSSAGAVGLMQIMPSTGRALGCDDLWNTAGNLQCGARLLRLHLTRFDNQVPYAVAAFQSGMAAAARAYESGSPPRNQTYVRKVLALAKRFQQQGCAPDP